MPAVSPRFHSPPPGRGAAGGPARDGGRPGRAGRLGRWRGAAGRARRLRAGECDRERTRRLRGVLEPALVVHPQLVYTRFRHVWDGLEPVSQLERYTSYGPLPRVPDGPAG